VSSTDPVAQTVSWYGGQEASVQHTVLQVNITEVLGNGTEDLSISLETQTKFVKLPSK
jgi:hypothetical protein